MNTEWENWLSQSSSDVCLITIEATETYVIFQVDDIEYKVASPEAGESEFWTFSIVDEEKSDLKNAVWIEETNSEFWSKSPGDPAQEYFDIIVEQYEKLNNEEEDEDEDDAWEQAQ